MTTLAKRKPRARKPKETPAEIAARNAALAARAAELFPASAAAQIFPAASVTGAQLKPAMRHVVEKIIRHVPGQAIQHPGLRVTFSGSGAFVSHRWGYVSSPDDRPPVHGVINLPAVADDATLTRGQANSLAGYLLHESAHCLFTNPAAYKVAVQRLSQKHGVPEAVAAKMLNCFEDVAIERNLLDLGFAPGFGALVRSLLGAIVERTVHNSPDIFASLAAGNVRGFGFACAYGLRGYAAGADAIVDAMHPKLRAIYDEAGRLMAALSPRTGADLEPGTARVADVVSRVFELLAEAGDEPGDGEPGGEPGQPDDGEPGDGEPGDGEPGDGEPDDGEPGDGEPGDGEPGDGEPGDGEPGDGEPGDGEPGDGEPGDGEPGDGEPGDGEPGDGEPGDGEPGDGEPGQPGDGDGEPSDGEPENGPVGEPGDGEPGRDSPEPAGEPTSPEKPPRSPLDGLAGGIDAEVRPDPLPDAGTAGDASTVSDIVLSTTAVKTATATAPEYDIDAARIHARKILAGAPRLAGDMRKILARSDTFSHQAGLTHGRLRGSALHRLLTGDDRIFERRTHEDGVSSAVSILIDASSSMNDFGRWAAAMDTALSLAEVCARCDGVTLEVATFASGGAGSDSMHSIVDALRQGSVDAGGDLFSLPLAYALRYTVYLAFGEPVGQLVRRTTGTRASGGTPDLEAIAVMAGRLLKRPEPRRVALVITDGDGARVDLVRETVARMERAGVIAIGIGIGCTMADRFTHCAEITSAADLGATAFRELCNALGRQYGDASTDWAA